MKKYIFLIFIGTLFTSCESFLNLEPETSLAGTVAFDNLDGIDAGINGVYHIIQSDWVERQYIFPECFANNVVEKATLSNSNYQAALRHESWTDLSEMGNYLWEMSYQSISQCNNLLVSLNEFQPANQAETDRKNELTGEVYFLRGLMYFILNRFWAQPNNGLSVPLALAPITPDDKPSRATIEEIKNQVLVDLQEAETLMATVTSNNDRATIYAVQALLARVNFEYKNYTDAENYADAVINSGKFTLQDGDVGAGFGVNLSSENVFTFLSITADKAAFQLNRRYSTFQNSNTQLAYSNNFYSVMSNDTADLRLKDLISENNGSYYSNKYDDRDMNLPYIRLPEMYLIRGESKANNNDLTGGLNDLNTIRQRANLTATTAANQTELLDKFYIERAKELALEGDNFHNLKRLEQSIGGLPWSEAQYKLVFYIPQTEVILNSNLVQNDPW